METEYYSEIALHLFRNSSSREQTQATKILGCSKTLREMVHVLPHIDIYSIVCGCIKGITHSLYTIKHSLTESAVLPQF